MGIDHIDDCDCDECNDKVRAERDQLRRKWEALKKAVRPFKLAWLNNIIVDLEEEYTP